MLVIIFSLTWKGNCKVKDMYLVSYSLTRIMIVKEAALLIFRISFINKFLMLPTETFAAMSSKFEFL